MEKIHRLDDAANFLMLVSDQEKGLTETCHLTPEEALNMLQPLHAKIDEETQNGKYAITASHLNLCEDSCHCGLYSDLAQDQRLKDKLFIKAQSLPKKKQIDCALITSKWICNDSLLKDLKSELSTMLPSNAQ